MKFNLFKKGGAAPEAKEQPRTDISINDIIAPSYIGVSQDYIKLGERIAKSFFIFSYPRYLDTGWLYPLINLNVPFDISFFIHPVDNRLILKKLVRKVTQVS